MTRDLASLVALVSLAALTACGSAPASTSSQGEGNTGTHNGSGGAGGAGNGQGGELELLGGMGGQGGSDFVACATSSEEATLIPVTMFITVDRSGSMGNDNKWNNAKSAFFAFFEDPEAASLYVALRFWPEGSCNGDQCNVDECATPHVPLGPLADAGHVSSLIDAFENRSPSGNTPMDAALAGASQWAQEHQQSVENGERTVIVMLTDGEPVGCDESISAIAAHAANAWAAEEIPTFAVGLEGSNENQMNQIAMAGGTSQGYFIGNGNASADLLAALKEIQKNTLACVYAMPEPQGGEPLDPTKVNVVYSPSDGSSPEPLGQVASEAACGGTGGWFYDDPLQPAIISLCPNTCLAVQADEGASIQVVLGCETKPA